MVVGTAFALPGTSTSAAISVCILDYQDAFTNTKGLGQILTDLGQAYTDKTTQVQGGQAIDLTGFDTFIIGSFCTQQATIKSQLTGASTTLRNFVSNGGTIITLTQADQTVAIESWVQSPVVITRGDSDFSTIYRVQAAHQIFTSPNTIGDVDLQGWNYVATSTWPGSWESFSTFQQVGVLAGNNLLDVTLATILEAGWGTGRAVFLAMAPDKARNIGNAQAKAQAPRLVKNLLQYAENVKTHTVPPVIIYSLDWSGAINGRVFNDANSNGVFDTGDSGLAGVGVSDTIDLVLTAADGTYTLPNSANNARLLYISLPAGYAKSSRWYQKLTSGSPPADFNFALTAANEPLPFDFAQITDIHVGGSGTKPLMTDALNQIAALKDRPAFIMATGDLVNVGGSLSQYDDYSSAATASIVKVFNVFGNHDVNNGGNSNYRLYLGPDYYSFSYADCHFLIINSVQKPAQQTNWVAKDIQLLRGTKRLFIFQHYSPSSAENTEYSGYNAKAVFTGHWHSQHTIKVGQMNSYNSPTFIFGGIDCSPAGFKIIHVDASTITSRPRWIADGKRLQIITPSNSVLVPQDNVQVLVNAYETSADISLVTYDVKQSGTSITTGSLTRQGDWSWRGTIPAASIPRGGYDLVVTATNDRNETSTATTTFIVLGSHSSHVATGADWPQFGGGPERGGATPTALDTPLGAVWCKHTGGTLDFGSPVLKDQSIYIGVKDRTDFANNGVMALDANDGTQQWFAPTPAAVSHSVAVDNTRVYACSHGGQLHAFNRSNGQPSWPAATLGSSTLRFQYGGPVLVGNLLYAGTLAYFGQFDAATGANNWNKTYGADWISSNACPAVKGTTVLVAGNWQTNSLIAVRTTDGGSVWQFPVYGLHGSPVISEDRVVFSDYYGQVHCLGLVSGVELWTHDLGGGSAASTPAVAFGTVVVGGVGNIKGFRLSDGMPLWTTPIGTSALKMAPYNNGFGALVGSATIADHVAYVPCGDGKLYGLTLETGAVRWSLNFGTPLLSAPCISGNMLYLSAFDGNIYALTSRSGFWLTVDYDFDNDVDQSDFAHMQLCLTPGGVVEILPGCDDADLNNDQLVDLQDMTAFINCLNGPDQLVNQSCLNSP